MFELNVPFVEKDQVKALGARWNAATKKWFVPTGIDAEIFKKWWPVDFIPFTAPSTEPTSQAAVQTNTLAQLLTRVQAVINQNFPTHEWVVAEISEISVHNGNYYLNLVEYNEGGQKQAQINARIWRDSAQFVLTKFKTATASDLVAGIKVLLQVSVSFNPQWGFSLTIDDIDPAYTLGDMAAKINNIKAILQQEKIFDKNKQFPAPKEFTRVAVISPATAAGLGDFQREAELLAKFDLCVFQYFTATFQGTSASTEILAAVEQVITANKVTPFDALVIIRGGGSVADLAWLNDLALARAICLAPLYVMVGIGHKRDYTVLDEVAACSFDTPSKVISHVLQVIVRNAELAFADFSECIQLAQQAINITTNNLQQLIANIKQDVHYKIEATATQITTSWQQLEENLATHCAAIEQQLESLIREVLCQSPTAVLSKGFAMATSLAGEVITSCQQAVAHRSFLLIFHDNKLKVLDSCIAEQDG